MEALGRRRRSGSWPPGRRCWWPGTLSLAHKKELPQRSRRSAIQPSRENARASKTDKKEAPGYRGIAKRAPSLSWERSKGLTSLVQRPQATGAKIHPTRLAINLHPLALDVGPELAIGRPLGVTDVVPKLRALATHFTLCHDITSQYFVAGRIIPQQTLSCNLPFHQWRE